MKSGIAINVLPTGMYATTAILATIEHRHVSGEVQYIDMSLLDCIGTINSCRAINYFLSGKIPQRMGNAHSTVVPYQVFHCREGDIIIAVGNDSQYAVFCKMINRPLLATDPQFSAGPQRNRNREALIPLIAEAMLAKTMREWVIVPEANNVPCSPIHNIKLVLKSPRSCTATCSCHCRTVWASTHPALPIRSACLTHPSATSDQRPRWANTAKPSCTNVSGCRRNTLPNSKLGGVVLLGTVSSFPPQKRIFTMRKINRNLATLRMLRVPTDLGIKAFDGQRGMS